VIIYCLKGKHKLHGSVTFQVLQFNRWKKLLNVYIKSSYSEIFGCPLKNRNNKILCFANGTQSLLLVILCCKALPCFS
jgi:hypothetical protein